MTTYNPGDTATLPLTIRVDGTLSDPDTVTISVEDPTGDEIETLDTVTRESTGIYHYSYTFASDALSGDYLFTWNLTTDDVLTTHGQLIELEIPDTDTYYSDYNSVVSRVKALEGIVDDDIIYEAMSTIDELLDNMLMGLPEVTSVPTAIEKAANYLVAADIIDILYSTSDRRSEISIQYESKAMRLLEPYL